MLSVKIRTSTRGTAQTYRKCAVSPDICPDARVCAFFLKCASRHIRPHPGIASSHWEWVSLDISRAVLCCSKRQTTIFWRISGVVWTGAKKRSPSRMYMNPETSQESIRHLEMLLQQVSGPTNELWLCCSKNGCQRSICALHYMDYHMCPKFNYTDNHLFSL
jgi:hypothetical protein